MNGVELILNFNIGILLGSLVAVLKEKKRCWSMNSCWTKL